MRGKYGGSEGGGVDYGMSAIAPTAQYCNYWCKRKSPIGGNVIADVSRQVRGRGWSGRHYGSGGSSTPTYSTINYLLEAAGIHHVMNNEEACEFGLQLGLDDDGNIICSTELVLGDGGGGGGRHHGVVGLISTYI